MAEIKSLDALMVWVMNKLAERFGPKAILKGGMLLKLLDCPRYTNDLDYIFSSYRSKKDIVAAILEALSELEGAKVHHSLHSTSLRIILEYNDLKVQIEANVSETCASQEMSTASLAHSVNQLPRIIRVMKLEEALAHKMAAWNERGLMRDLYDIYYFYTRLKIKPDLDVLKKRLSKINDRQKSTHQSKVKSMTMNDFLAKLQKTAELIDDQSLKAELQGTLSVEELVGLNLKIRRSLLELIENIQE